jgi:aspartate kinase
LVVISSNKLSIKEIAVVSIVVQKFGGTSVGSIERIQAVARIIANSHDQGHQVVTVVSAMGHSTDELVALAKLITETPSGRELDALLVTGEMVSAALVAMTLNTMGYKAISLNGQQAGFVTENLHNRARILEIDTGRIQSHLNQGEIVIITGFQGINSQADFCTLGRGGSDTSAVALAGALGADNCDIYTDVDGVYSTDPRIVPEAVRIDDMTYIEMLELARVGAQVLHPRAVETGRNADVRIRVRSTFKTEDTGTVISETLETRNRPVSGIAADDNQARLAMVGVPDHPGVAGKIFGALASKNVSVDMIIQSLNREDKNDIAFTVSASDLPDALETLERVKTEIQAEALLHDADVCKVSIVGIGMIDRPGIAADMFAALAEAKINIKMIATSEIKISCLIEKNQSRDAIQALHSVFFPEQHTHEPTLVNQKIGY